MAFGGYVGSAAKKVGNSVSNYVSGNETARQAKKGNALAAAREFTKDTFMGGQRDAIRKATGKDTSGQKAQQKKAEKARQNEAAETKKKLGGMKSADEKLYKKESQGIGDYKASRNNSVSEYLGRLNEVDNQARNQATDAQTTYTNQIQPQMKGIMEDARTQAGQAMSLSEAGNVNNSVHRGVRDLYDQQAQAVGNRSLHDVGVLNALGAQATAGQMGNGVPMTGSQMQLLNAQNQQASGLAYARAQQQMQSLREQGLERGFDESNAQYERGERARDRYRGSVGDYESAMDRNIARQGAFRDESMGYGADRFGVKLGKARENRALTNEKAGMRHGLTTGQYQRDLGEISNRYGNQQEQIAAKIAQMNADNASKSAMASGVMGMAGAGVGAFAGGPAGAMAGYQVGQGAGGAMTGGGQQVAYQPQQRNPYQYQGYNSGGYARYT